MSDEQREAYQNQQRQLHLNRSTLFNKQMLQQQQQTQMALAGNHQGVSGLGGIGMLAQAPDMQKMHMRGSQFGDMSSQASQSPRLPGAPSPVSMNGSGMHVPSPSRGPMQGATPSPAPSASLAKPSTPA